MSFFFFPFVFYLSLADSLKEGGNYWKLPVGTVYTGGIHSMLPKHLFC